MLCSRFLVEEDAEAVQEELREAFRLYDKEGNGYIKTSGEQLVDHSSVNRDQI